MIKRLLIGFLAAVAVLLAVNTVATDRATKPPSADLGHTYVVPGGALQARYDGDHGNRPIVLLHGFAGSMHWWSAVAERLAHRFYVVRIDLLGHGGSAKPASGYSMPNQARLVAGVLRRLRVRRAVVVGHSMGGLVATALAEQRPDMIDGLVLVDSPPTEGAGKLPFLARLGFVPVLGEALRHLATDGMIRGQLEREFAPGFKVPDQFVRDFHRMTYTSYDDSHAQASKYLRQKPLPQRLAAVGKPLLAIFGAEDRLVDPASQRKYSAVPGASLAPIQGAGHSPMVEKPDQVSALIERFALTRTR